MITIEKYNSEMVSELWQVYFTSIRLVCSNNYSKEQIEVWAPENLDINLVRQKMDQIKPFVAMLGDKIIGYADLQTDGLIDHFFVHGKYQGLGAGAALMTHIVNEGSHMPKLYSYVSNTAKAFYRKYGFVVKNVRLEKIRGCGLENNLMVRHSAPY